MTTIHFVSHTHWDREWYQTFQQFRLRLVHLVDLLLDILDQDKDYSFYMLDGQTVVLEDYLEVRPERKEDLRRYIQSGRILIGPWYILPDEFLVSPEATIRNLLEGDRDARAFGPKMMVGYIPDPFGHIGQMPQILRGFGIETASVMRGLADEPCEFWWQAPDGSRVLMGYLRTSYGNAAGILTANLDQFVSELSRLRDVLGERAATGNVLLMHGIDHMEPQPETTRAIAYANQRFEGDLVAHSTLPDYFAAVLDAIDEKDLPVVVGELRSSKRFPLLPGVLSARMWIKQRNQQCQTLLERWADPFSAWAELLPPGIALAGNLRKPEAALRQAWRLLMLCHPHDSICGCSIDQVHDEMRPRFDQVEQVGEVITGQSLAALAGAVNTAESISTTANDAGTMGDKSESSTQTAIVVFNATGSPRSGAVKATVEVPTGSMVELMDENGRSIPFQTLGLGSSEIFNMVMGRNEVREGFNMISGGELMGMRILGIHYSREGSQVKVEMVMSEKGEPDLIQLEADRQQMQGYLNDPSVTSFQILAHSAPASEVVFSVADVPGFGYRTFLARSYPLEGKPPMQLSPLARALVPLATRFSRSQVVQGLAKRILPDPSAKGPFRIENEFVVVEAAQDGTLTITDRRSGRNYAGLNRFDDGGDRGDEYNYSKPDADQIVTAHLERARVERGVVIQALELWLALDVPVELTPDRKGRAAQKTRITIYSRVSLAQASPQVEILTEVDNQARDHRLRAHFPAPFAVTDAEYDGHFEIVRRPLALPVYDAEWVEHPRPEVPQRAFTYISDGQAALAVANRGLPEVETFQRADGQAEIALTLLRCVGWLSRGDLPERPGNAGPAVVTPGAQMPGKWSFEYALILGQAAERQAILAEAYAFETPMRTVSTGIHEGILPAKGAFVRVEPADFTVSTVKKAEDGRGWLVRGVNLSDRLLNVRLETLFTANTAEICTMAEETVAPLVLEEGKRVSFVADPHQVVTVRFL